jgi:hypothetical protein
MPYKVGGFAVNKQSPKRMIFLLQSDGFDRNFVEKMRYHFRRPLSQTENRKMFALKIFRPGGNLHKCANKLDTLLTK